MGPFALFDKSFLQSLSVDESVWFDHFFTPIVCPLFYVETLADLKKMKLESTSEAEVKKIAHKFPEASGSPCAFHTVLCINDLLGNHVPMRNQIPRSGGRLVKAGGKSGVVYGRSDEAEAFIRWSDGKFTEIERLYAEEWRNIVQNLKLDESAKVLRKRGIDPKSCKSPEDAINIANNIISESGKSINLLISACDILQVPNEHRAQILRRWTSMGCPPLDRFAKYAAYVLRVHIFFQIALAADFVSAQRPSNAVDMSYLYYLPFCNVFISSDNLHRKIAPLFIRDDQEFVWGTDLKSGLSEVNNYFDQLSVEIKEKGIISFARTPPIEDEFLVSKLWEKYGWHKKKQLEEDELNIDPSIVEEMLAFADAPSISDGDLDFDPQNPERISISRRIRKKKGSWYQIPKDLIETKG